MIDLTLFITGQIQQAAPQQPQSLWFILFIATALLLAVFAVGAFVFYSKRVAQFKDYKQAALEQMEQLRCQAEQQQPQPEPLDEPMQPLCQPDQAAADQAVLQAEEKLMESAARLTERENEIASLRAMLEAANREKALLENKLEMSDDNLKIKDQMLAKMSQVIDQSGHSAEPQASDAAEASDKKIDALLRQLNEANSLRDHAESEAKDCQKQLAQALNENMRLKEELNVVNHAYDQYQAEYQDCLKNHEAELSQLRNEYSSTVQNIERQYSRQLNEQISLREAALSELRDKYESTIKNLQEDYARRAEQAKIDSDQRVADLVANHSYEIENAKRALSMEISRISDDYEHKINEQNGKHSAELRSLAAAHQSEMAEKSSLLEQKERQLDMMQAKCQAEIHRLAEENEDRIARVALAKDAEMSKMAQEADSRIKQLTERAAFLFSQLQAARESLVAGITSRFAAMTPGISRLAADARVINGDSMAAYLTENMLDAFGYAVTDFKNAVDKLDDSDSAQQMQTKLRASVVEKWLDQNGWVATLCQLSAYARIPAMNSALREAGIDTMLLARLQADAADLLGCFDVAVVVPAVLADDFDSASMEPVSARTIIDRINPDIVPRDHVGKVFDLVIPGYSTPTASQKPRVVYF